MSSKLKTIAETLIPMKALDHGVTSTPTVDPVGATVMSPIAMPLTLWTTTIEFQEPVVATANGTEPSVVMEISNRSKKPPCWVANVNAMAMDNVKVLSLMKTKTNAGSKSAHVPTTMSFVPTKSTKPTTERRIVSFPTFLKFKFHLNLT